MERRGRPRRPGGRRARPPAPHPRGRRSQAGHGPNPEPGHPARLRRAARSVNDALAGLGAHSPSRTLVLRRHGFGRLDAELAIEWRVCRRSRPGGRLPRPGHADGRRLSPGARRLAARAPSAHRPAHRPLAAGARLADPRPAPTGPGWSDPGGLQRRRRRRPSPPRRAGASARVHDLAWGRLEFWRAATAAAFEPLERRTLLPQVAGLDVATRAMPCPPGCCWPDGWRRARTGARTRSSARMAGRAGRPCARTVARWRCR